MLLESRRNSIGAGSGMYSALLHYRYGASALRALAICSSYLSPIASSIGLVYIKSPRFSPWYSRMCVSTIASTGHDSSQKPQKMHLVRSMS